MAEELVSQQEEVAPAAAPAPLTSAEIQAMIAAEAQRIVDQRIPGLQSVYEKQIASLKKELKRAQDDPDGVLSSSSSDLEAELAKARREADALRAGRQFPDAFPVYEGLMSASSVEEQLELLQGFVTGRVQQAQPQSEPEQAAPAAEPEAPTPPVDLNRPMTAVPAIAGGVEMNKGLADRIFDSLGNQWPRFG